MKVLDVKPVVVEDGANMADIPLLRRGVIKLRAKIGDRIAVKEDIATNPTNDISLLVEFKTSPNGRTKSIIASDEDVLHVEPDFPLGIYTAIQLPSPKVRRRIWVAAGRKTGHTYAQIAAVKLANAQLRTEAGLSLGIYKKRHKAHREWPSKTDIAEFFDALA